MPEGFLHEKDVSSSPVQHRAHSVAKTVDRGCALYPGFINPPGEPALDLTRGKAGSTIGCEKRAGRVAFQVSAKVFHDLFAEVDLIGLISLRDGEVQNTRVEVNILDVQGNGRAEADTGGEQEADE